MASNFMSSAPLSASWTYAEGGFINICLSQGRTFLDRLKAAVGLPAGGAWDDALQARLLSVVNQLLATDSRWQTVFSALTDDSSSHLVRDESLRVGLWLAFYRANGRRFDAIQIAQDTVFPQWDVSPPATRSTTTIVCYDPMVDTDPVILPSAELSSAASHSRTGVRIESGRSAPSSSTAIISSQKPAVPTWAVILVSTLVAAGAVAVLAKGSKGTPKTRSRRRR